MRVLVVEDEALVAIDIADILSEAGFHIVGPAASVEKALKLIGEFGCDAAVLDMNLRGETAEPIAWELRLRQTPFLFLSAISKDQMPVGLDGEVLLPKPARPDVLISTLRSFLDKSQIV